MAASNKEKILIVGPAWVGDMVMAQSLFIDLHQRLSNIEIHVLAPAWTAALIERMPEVTSLVKADFVHGKLGLSSRFKLARQIKSMGFDRAIVLPNSLKAALVPWLAKIPVRTGWVGEQRWFMLNDVRRLDKKKWPMTVQRFIALGEKKLAQVRELDTVPAPKLVVDDKNVKATRDAIGLHSDAPVLALCPGAEFGRSKQWPPEYFASVANSHLRNGWQVWILGSDKDLAVAVEINNLCQARCEVLTGKTSLPQATDLLSCATLVVSNDSGLMHIAAALQIPLVAVYGSTDPGHTPPLSKNHQIAQLSLECQPCFKRECPLQHHNCMKKLLPENVKQQLSTLVHAV
ncbi:MAG: lipopolysaccharide heptosyltransferase II [Pseudomonadota bacterium]